MSSTWSLGALVTVNLLVSAVVQGVILVVLGPGPDTDALFASLTIPQLLLVITSGPAARVLVPLMSEHTEDAAATRRAAWTFLQTVGGSVALVSLVLAATADVWVRVVFPGFAPEALALTTRLTRVQLAGVVFTATTTVLAAFHQSQHRFLRVEVALLGGAALMLTGVGLGLPAIGVTGVAWLALAQAVAQTVLLLPGLGAYGRPQWRAPVVREAGRRLLPLFAGALVYKNERTIDRMLASYAARGDLSLLALAHQACTSAAILLNRAVTAPLVPSLTRHVGRGDAAAFRATWRAGATRVLWLTTTVYTGGAIAGVAIVPLLPTVGQITSDDLRTLWILSVALGGYLIAGSCAQVVSAAFYAQGDTITPTRVGITAFVASIPLRAMGLALLGVPGIALGSSAYHLLNAMALWTMLERRSLRPIQPGESPVGAAPMPSWRRQ